MQNLTINDIYDLAIKTYNLKINDKTEEQNIKRKIRRALNKRNMKKPYKLTFQQAEWIIEYDLRTYLLNKSLETNPKNYIDLKEFNTQIQQNQAVQPITQTEAEILIKLNHILRLLGDETFFEQPKFDKNYQAYINNIFSNRLPKPNYQTTKNDLLYSKYFINPLTKKENQ
ncbi:hypothetical protein [Lactobacillus kefiranofaciens]|uniref:hypothetical protein n=1 Tax=Lactobacillus kefiranofaciens TaxID=267818 RepID=UPI0021C4A5C4|nr:hypothetical protein [Lactobacillus kefiranofaciens]MCP9331723.1 hypothetical protein [Lactobacillus kefiranofaciens]